MRRTLDRDRVRDGTRPSLRAARCRVRDGTRPVLRAARWVRGDGHSARAEHSDSRDPARDGGLDVTSCVVAAISRTISPLGFRTLINLINQHTFSLGRELHQRAIERCMAI